MVATQALFMDITLQANMDLRILTKVMERDKMKKSLNKTSN